MVNSTALESILKFIQKQNIKKMKPWSQRSSSNSKETADWYIRKLRKQILELLAIVSGDEIIEMLKDVLSKDQLDLLTPKDKDALKNLVRKRI